ncbi:MAG: DUF523 domain-containing protein, partial [Rectinema sp.]|nr:DUF523 domain-containing protein [Rectinema sp.]
MILVSACLAGVACRYDGGTATDPRVVALMKAGNAIAVCPEQLGGLPTPREPSELRDGRVWSKSGRDVTGLFVRGALATLEVAMHEGCRVAILKSHSPSCGSGCIYDGTFSSTLAAGDGVTARVLKAHGIRVLTEEEY